VHLFKVKHGLFQSCQKLHRTTAHEKLWSQCKVQTDNPKLFSPTQNNQLNTVH